MPQVSLGGPFLPPQLFLLPFLILPSMDQWGLVVLQGRESLGRAGGAGLPHLGPAWKERGEEAQMDTRWISVQEWLFGKGVDAVGLSSLSPSQW